MCIGLKYSANTRRLPVLARTHSAQKNLPSITTSVNVSGPKKPPHVDPADYKRKVPPENKARGRGQKLDNNASLSVASTQMP